jgi:hypothetical protein
MAALGSGEREGEGDGGGRGEVSEGARGVHGALPLSPPHLPRLGGEEWPARASLATGELTRWGGAGGRRGTGPVGPCPGDG